MKLPASRREWKEILPINLSGTGRCLNAHVSRRTEPRSLIPSPECPLLSGPMAPLPCVALFSAEPGLVLGLPRDGMQSPSQEVFILV